MWDLLSTKSYLLRFSPETFDFHCYITIPQNQQTIYSAIIISQYTPQFNTDIDWPHHDRLKKTSKFRRYGHFPVKESNKTIREF
jgi:hypothetical protein